MKAKLNFYLHTSPPLKSILINVNLFIITSYFGNIYFNIIPPFISQVVYSLHILKLQFFYTELFEMFVGVLTICHAQYT